MTKNSISRYLFTLVILLSCLPALSNSEKTPPLDKIKQRAIEGIRFLTNNELKERINNNPTLVLIDVRTQREYEAGHLLGASWIERGIAEFVLARTLTDKNSEIIIYCKKGYRASLVVKSLRGMGYNNVRAHAGFDAWVLAGNSYINYLGESRLVKLAAINSANFKPDYYRPKQ